MQIILFIYFIFNFINCNKIRNSGTKIRNAEEIENIDVLSIAYELTYATTSVIKVIIKTINDLEGANISFNAFLLSENEDKEYIIHCQNTSETIIECYTKNEDFNIKDKYYFYYERGDDGKYTFDEKDNFEDYKRVSLIFKPEIEEDQIMYLDHRKIIGFNNRQVVGGGYLYLVRKSKKLLSPPEDGFNALIDLNNYIFQPSYKKKSEITAKLYIEAVQKGFRIIEAKVQFTKDKEAIIFNGKTESKTLKELEKKNDDILTLIKLLKLCKINNVIVEVNLAELDYKKYFKDTDEYMNIIIDIIKNNNMLDSIYFNDGGDYNKILKLNEIQKDISVCLSNEDNIKKGLKELKDPGRIIYDLDEKKLKKKEVKNAIALGYKIKISNVNNLEYAEEIQSWGVNYIATNKIHPFLIKNEYEAPILLKCTQFDILVDCRLGPEVKLFDNEIYSIYYSKNIYAILQDIVEEPIGEFKYLDTKKLDDIFYTIPDFDFKNNFLALNSSVKITKNKNITGFVGPAGYEASEIYQYKFTCKGNDKYEVDCFIDRDDKNKIKFKGKYSVYRVENYSRYVPPEIKKELLFNKLGNQSSMSNITFSFCVLFISLIFIILIYYANNKTFIQRMKMKKNIYMI